MNRGIGPGFLVALMLPLGFMILNATVARQNSSHGTTNVLSRQSSTRKIGGLAWLGSLWPAGIHFQGPVAEADNQPEVLATSHCFESGGGYYCSGLHDLQEYTAAVHASQDLHIPFERVEAKISNGLTLEQALRELRPDSNYKFEAEQARREALDTLRDSSS